MTIQYTSRSEVDAAYRRILSSLTPEQVVQLAGVLEHLCEVGYGQATITVKAGRPFSITESVSIKLVYNDLK